MADTTITAIQPISVLSPSAPGIRSIGHLSKNVGIVSFATMAFQMVWDYEKYGHDPILYATSIAITAFFTGAAIAAGALITASGVGPAVALALSIGSGILISFAEDNTRKWLLE